MTSTPGVLIGVDVGCTTMSGGLVTPEGVILSSAQAPTCLGSGTAVGTILGMVTDLAAEARTRGLALEAVGIGIPGLAAWPPWTRGATGARTVRRPVTTFYPAYALTIIGTRFPRSLVDVVRDVVGIAASRASGSS